MINNPELHCIGNDCDVKGPFEAGKWIALFLNRQAAELWTNRTNSWEGANLTVACPSCYDKIVARVKAQGTGIGHPETAVVAYDLFYTEDDGFSRDFTVKVMLNAFTFINSPDLHQIFNQLKEAAKAIEEGPVPGFGAMS